VIDHEVVSRDDDNCAQRHERLGTKKLYQRLDSQHIGVRRHGHDRNGSVNKFVREERPQTTNQNDTWHVSVSVAKELKKVSTGAKCREGKTWSHQLIDKVVPVKTHINFAMRRCGGDKDILKRAIDNIVCHYQNQHTDCFAESRCKTDSNYMPSRQILTDPVAVDLLSAAVQSTDVYRRPENYVHYMDTYFVESFNNVLNMFHDKRIGTFGYSHYAMRTDLAILHWNENVMRSRISYRYRGQLWARWMGRALSTSVWRPC